MTAAQKEHWRQWLKEQRCPDVSDLLVLVRQEVKRRSGIQAAFEQQAAAVEAAHINT